jgi:hypothetical protein
MAGLAMTVPLFIPSRWRRPPRALRYTVPGESTPGQPAACGSAYPDWAVARREEAPAIPPPGSQPPRDQPRQG